MLPNVRPNDGSWVVKALQVQHKHLRARPQRHRLGRVVDRILTPLIGFGGRLISRPSDEELSEHSGRIRGGEEGQTAVAALEAGRRALGDGHFARAYLATDETTNMVVCVKLFHSTDEKSQIAYKQELVAGFMQLDHPNITKLCGYGCSQLIDENGQASG